MKCEIPSGGIREPDASRVGAIPGGGLNPGGGGGKKLIL